METQAQEFIMTLKKLSKEYKFKTSIPIRLSAELFEINTYGLLMIKLQEDPTCVSLYKLHNLKNKIIDSLEKIEYPFSLDIDIISTEKILEKYGIYIKKGIRHHEDEFIGKAKINFEEDETSVTKVKFTNPKEIGAESQNYKLIIDQGFAKLEPKHDEETHNFHSNLKVVDFVNTLIDEKIGTYDPTDVLTIAASIRNVKEKLRKRQTEENIVNSQFALHYENHDATGLFNIIETTDDSKVELGFMLNRIKTHTDLPLTLVGRIIDKGMYSPYVRMNDCIIKEKLSDKSLNEIKKDIEIIIESFLADTELTLDDVRSAYLNLDHLVETRYYTSYNRFYLFSNNKLIAQINFSPRKIRIPIIIERVQNKIQENIERFLYETHGNGYHFLTERINDNESTNNILLDSGFLPTPKKY
jgi:hypothetical protein